MKQFIFIVLISLKTSIFCNTSDSLAIPLKIIIENHSSVYHRLPIPFVYNSPLHPGISISSYKTICSKSAVKLQQGFSIGYYYHAFSQHAIRLFTETGVDYRLPYRFGLTASIAYGYLHSIADIQEFELVEGKYQPTNSWGRAQFIGGLILGANYDLSKHIPMKIVFEYAFMVQGPFVKSYVPIVPNTSIGLGCIYYIKK